MADHQQQETEAASKGCGMFDFLKKKQDEKAPEDTLSTHAHTDTLCHHTEPMEHKETPSLADKLHRSDSSSSDEEEGENGEKKNKNKKGLKEKIKEKVSGHGKEVAETKEEAKADEKEEKKGIMEKIKEKLPGGHGGKAEHEADHHDDNDKDQKGLFDKIKEKLPGHHQNNDDKKKET